MQVRNWGRWYVLVGAVTVTKVGNWRPYGKASSNLIWGSVLECDWVTNEREIARLDRV